MHLATEKANEVVDLLPEQRNFFVPLNSDWHKKSHGRDGRGLDETTGEKQTSWAKAYVRLVASNLLKEPVFFRGL